MPNETAQAWGSRASARSARALARLLAAQARRVLPPAPGATPEIAAYSARSRGRSRACRSAARRSSPTPSRWRRTADIDVFVELIGGADGAAYAAVKAALARGIPVVTANKAMLAAHGVELAELAERARRGARLRGGGRRRRSRHQDPARGAGRQPHRSGSAAFSTAPATTSCRRWRPSGCRSTSA